jgi:hypothetical protein
MNMQILKRCSTTRKFPPAPYGDHQANIRLAGSKGRCRLGVQQLSDAAEVPPKLKVSPAHRWPAVIALHRPLHRAAERFQVFVTTTARWAGRLPWIGRKRDGGWFGRVVRSRRCTPPGGSGALSRSGSTAVWAWRGSGTCWISTPQQSIRSWWVPVARLLTGRCHGRFMSPHHADHHQRLWSNI